MSDEKLLTPERIAEICAKYRDCVGSIGHIRALDAELKSIGHIAALKAEIRVRHQSYVEKVEAQDAEIARLKAETRAS